MEPRTRRVVLANLLKCAADQHTACREFDRWMDQNKRFFITQEERLNKLFHLRVAEPRGLRKVHIPPSSVFFAMQKHTNKQRYFSQYY